MKQPLMLIPPAQAEALSDHLTNQLNAALSDTRWTDAEEIALGELRSVSLRWLGDDLPDETSFASTLPVKTARRRSGLRAA